MDDQTIEQRVIDASLTAPRVTKARIDELMARVVYTFDVRPNGSTTTFAHAFLDGEFFLATGKSACVSTSNFNEQLGKDIAMSNAESAARDKLWEMEGYSLRAILTTNTFVIARIAHEVNRAYCAALGDSSQPEWANAPDWQRDSAMVGVRMHMEREATPEESHESWMAQKLAEGWIYGPVKDPVRKEHPCMVAYADLPQEQRVKDYLFRAVVHSFKGA